MAEISRDGMPELSQLLGCHCIPDWEEHCLDPVVQLDDFIWASLDDGTLPALWSQVQELVRQSPDEESAERHLLVWCGHSGWLDGTSWLEFLHLVRDRVQRAVEHPELRERFEHSDRHYTRRRFSRFTDKETANGACTMVLRAHEPAVRRWVADRGGWWRQHYTADLGRPVGTFTDHESGFAGEVTGAAVVMRIDNESGQPFIFDAWPEHPLDPAPREAFPDLVHVFGGYFSGVPGPPFVAQQNLHVSLADPARSRVRRQLDALLELDDDALRRALVALGSHVLPVAHRRWVELMRWRLDAYPWRRASGLE